MLSASGEARDCLGEGYPKGNVVAMVWARGLAAA
jgi:hypothetical protein